MTKGLVFVVAGGITGVAATIIFCCVYISQCLRQSSGAFVFLKRKKMKRKTNNPTICKYIPKIKKHKKAQKNLGGHLSSDSWHR